MKLNNKGFTLMELLAVMVIIGVVMAVTIPNISGISEQNKITTYAEDAKKFKNSVEYMIRGDDTVPKPESNGECVVVSLNYLHGNEYDNPPNSGEYLKNKSFVVMVKKDKQYHYYVRLIEELPDGNGYRGFNLIDSSELSGDRYFDDLLEAPTCTGCINVDSTTTDAIGSIVSSTGCNSLLNVYHTNE